MRSQAGSSLVAVLAVLMLIGALGAAFVPAMLHPKATAGAPASAPAGQDAVDAARNAVLGLDAQQRHTATAP
jgi:type II secretory pathway pseudopilin PulG